MLFVSCQPFEKESYYTNDFILNMAYAAKLGGAKGLRIEGIDNISRISKNLDLPIIGIIKKKTENNERYITPTYTEINSVLKMNCDYIAIDYTLRDNYSIKEYNEITKYIHSNSECKIVADISDVKEAKMAKTCGVDMISTTLRGYTNYTKGVKLPDIKFIKELKHLKIETIIAEGGYSTHSEYVQALKMGAKIVVIGTAITRPHLIIKKILTGNY